MPGRFCSHTVQAALETGEDYQVQVYFIGHGKNYQGFSPAFAIEK